MGCKLIKTTANSKTCKLTGKLTHTFKLKEWGIFDNFVDGKIVFQLDIKENYLHKLFKGFFYN